MTKPIIGISMGDPAGIGPEIVAKMFRDSNVHKVSRPFLIGDAAVMREAIRIAQLSFDLNIVKNVRDAAFVSDRIDMIDLHNIDMDECFFGKVNAMCGKAAYEYVKTAADMAMTGDVDAVVTTPINKESLRAAKIPFIGHTEIFASVSGVEDPLTMFEVHNLRVFFLTRHVSLRQACDLVTCERLMDYIARSLEAMKRLGVSGTLAVAGLNPHSGEHGLFGTEEVDCISPTVEEAIRQGYDVVGPVGADSVFAQALTGRYAAVLSLYHDQGHIATKTLDFERTIAVTNSMPFLRTSVDHGTAFDIAWKNCASEISMIEAVKLAAKYAPNFKRNK